MPICIGIITPLSPQYSGKLLNGYFLFIVNIMYIVLENKQQL